MASQRERITCQACGDLCGYDQHTGRPSTVCSFCRQIFLNPPTQSDTSHCAVCQDALPQSRASGRNATLCPKCRGIRRKVYISEAKRRERDQAAADYLAAV